MRQRADQDKRETLAMVENAIVDERGMISNRVFTRAPNEVSRPGSHPRVDSQQLMKATREIIIEHGQETYRLRITAAGKLILTK